MKFPKKGVILLSSLILCVFFRNSCGLWHIIFKKHINVWFIFYHIPHTLPKKNPKKTRIVSMNCFKRRWICTDMFYKIHYKDAVENIIIWSENETQNQMRQSIIIYHAIATTDQFQTASLNNTNVSISFLLLHLLLTSTMRISGTISCLRACKLIYC